MNRAALLTSLGLIAATTGCGEKTAPEPAATAAVEEVPKGNIPADAKSEKFAQKLVNSTIENFKPSDGMGAKFVYNTFTFSMDNTWKASGYVEASGESMDCKESGTWTMDPAETESTAMMNWTLVETDCAGREVPSDSRVEVTITKDGRVEIAFR